MGGTTDEDFKYVTCGSTIKLKHANTNYRLHSHDIPYGSGSKQQSVTAHPAADDPNSLWTIKAGFGYPGCRHGEPIEAGAVIRLQHAATKKYLHSHHFASPISGNQEVSAYGGSDHSDTGDNWIVEGRAKWIRGEKMRLKHVDTGMYLFSHRKAYSNPIPGQLEVCGVPHKNAQGYWFTEEGIYFSKE